MKYILAVLLAAILLFGCTQPGGRTQTGTGGTSGGTGATGGTGAGTGTGATTGGTTGGTGGTTGGTGGTGGTTGGETGGFSMDEWSMDALMAAGAPMKCIVTWGGEAPGQYTIYVKGQKVRMEGTYQSMGHDVPYISIMKDNVAYMPATMMAGAPGFENCDWLSITSEEETTGGDTTITQPVDYDTPPVSYDCNPDVFGEEKFATPGIVCDFQEMMQQQYASYCEGLTGDAYTQCMAAFQ